MPYYLHASYWVYAILFLWFLGIDITPGGVLCEEPSRAVRKLESNTRLQSNRLNDIIDGLENYLDSSMLQVFIDPISS